VFESAHACTAGLITCHALANVTALVQHKEIFKLTEAKGITAHVNRRKHKMPPMTMKTKSIDPTPGLKTTPQSRNMAGIAIEHAKADVTRNSVRGFMTNAVVNVTNLKARMEEGSAEQSNEQRLWSADLQTRVDMLDKVLEVLQILNGAAAPVMSPKQHREAIEKPHPSWRTCR
jgi:hypothetical protein